MNKIFVYGTLKKHQPNFAIIKSGIFCGVGRLDKSYELRMVSMGSFPALIPSGKNSPQEISGEIWSVDDESFKNVDCLEGYPTFYEREQFTILDSADKKHTCWAYFIPDELSTKELTSVDNGTWYGYEDSAYGVGGMDYSA